MKLVLLAYVLVAVFVRRGTGENKPLAAGGMQLVSDAYNIHGNNVTKRNNYLPSGAKKTWVDFQTALPAGRLVEYYLFVGLPGSHGITQKTARVRLQIWRPSIDVPYYYKLVWEQRVNVNITNPDGLLYAFKVNAEGFRVFAYDRIGWTNEDVFSAINFAYREGHRTYFRKHDNNDYPLTNVSYIFDKIHLPAIFSVAVKIISASSATTTYTTIAGSITTTKAAAALTTTTSAAALTTHTTTTSSITTTTVTTTNRSSGNSGMLIAGVVVGSLLVASIIGFVVGYAWRSRTQTSSQNDCPNDARASEIQTTPTGMQERIASQETGHNTQYEQLHEHTPHSNTQSGVYSSINNTQEVGEYGYEKVNDVTPSARVESPVYIEVI